MRRNVLLAPLLGAALLTTSARADEVGERDARVLFGEANKKVEDGDYVGALERFRAAYARWSNPKILINIGTMLRQLGRNAEAADTYAAYLQDPAADPAKKPEMKKALKDLDAKVGKLTVLVDPNAAVRVDGNEAGKPGGVVELRLEPGHHTITAEREGESPVIANVTAVAGEQAQVSLHFAAPVAHPAHPESPPSPTDLPAAPPVLPPGKDITSTRPASLSHKWQVGLIARADFSPQPPGGVTSALGLAFGLGDHVEINTCALLGKNKGVEPGATVLFLKGVWKPRLSVGVPIFFQNEAYAGVHGSAGVQWDPIRYIGVFVDVGVVGFPSVPNGFQGVVFVPSIGIEPRW